MLYAGYECDECHYAFEYKRLVKEWFPSKKCLVDYAQKAGWSIGEKILCPRCRKKIKYNRA